MRLPETRQTLEVNEAPSSGLVILFSFVKLVFWFSETAVPSACARILGLDWKLYPGNIQYNAHQRSNLSNAESFSCGLVKGRHC